MPKVVRAITRAIRVLQEINRGGSASMMTISKMSGVPYPSTRRIVASLQSEGLIEREPDRKRYKATPLIQSLSFGYQSQDRLARIASPHLETLTTKVRWPTVIAARSGHSLIIRGSTHAITPFTLTNFYAGDFLPYLDTASGRAYLAFAEPAEREGILRSIEVLEPDKMSRKEYAAFKSEGLAEKIRDDGYAAIGRHSLKDSAGHSSSIAVPVFQDAKLVAVLALVYFAKAMKMSQAIALYLDDLKACAAAIAADLEAFASDKLIT